MAMVGLVVHGGREEALAAAAGAATLLRRSGTKVVGVTGDGWDDEREADGGRVALPFVQVREPADFGDGLDVVVVFGGDGTFLRAAYLARDRGVPLLGVNLGRLGFLSEVEAGQIPATMAQVVAGEYDVEERMTLAVEVRDALGTVVATSWALNDASVERAEPQRLVVLRVAVGDVVFADIPADAVICATPTGSTAYAFSAGGPILSPQVDAILVVPVAPHSLFNRTLIVDPVEELTVRAVGGSNTCVVSCDGRETIRVPDGGSVRVLRGAVPVRLARLGPADFYARVREKFGLR